MIQPYPYHALPRVSRDEVDVIDAFHRDYGLWQLLLDALVNLSGSTVQADVVHIGMDRPHEPPVGAGWICGLVDSSGMEVGWVHLDSPLAQALAAIALCGKVPEHVELRPLLPVECEGLQVLLSHLLGTCGARLQVRPIGRLFGDIEETRSLGRVCCRLRFDGSTGLLTWWLDTARWSRLQAIQPGVWQVPPRALIRTPLWRTHRQPVRLLLARFQMSRGDLQSLRPGDVLLPRAFNEPGPPRVGTLLFGYSPLIRGVIEWKEAIVFQFSNTDLEQGRPMNHNQDMTEKTAIPDALDEDAPTVQTPPVILDLVVGRLEMTLGEVASIRPGRILTICERVDEPIDLVHQGRIVGRGELVEVEGRLGVRILSLPPPPV